VITPAKFGEKNGDKGNTMIMASTRDTIVWTMKLLYNEDENWNSVGQGNLRLSRSLWIIHSPGIWWEFWQISETLNRRRNRFISLSFIGERRNPDCTAGIPIRQFRHL